MASETYASCSALQIRRYPARQFPVPLCVSEIEHPESIAAEQSAIGLESIRLKFASEPAANTFLTIVPEPEHDANEVHRDTGTAPPVYSTHARHWYVIPEWFDWNDTVTAGAAVIKRFGFTRVDSVIPTKYLPVIIH